MKIFFETLNDPINLHSLMLLADNGDFFYAEPVNNAVIGHGLLFNEHMFRTKNIWIIGRIKGWLSIDYKSIEIINTVFVILAAKLI